MSLSVCFSAHLRPGCQVKLLFMSPFQRLIFLREHAVYRYSGTPLNDHP